MDESQDVAALIGQGSSGNKSYIIISIPFGGHKIQLVADELKNHSCQERRNSPCTPSHAVTDAVIQNISELEKE